VFPLESIIRCMCAKALIRAPPGNTPVRRAPLPVEPFFALLNLVRAVFVLIKLRTGIAIFIGIGGLRLRLRLLALFYVPPI
jgi:hypothetical protein